MRSFEPELIFLTDEREKAARDEVMAKDLAAEKRKLFLRSTRNSKFGTQLQVTRPDGSKMMVTNIYQKNFDTNNLGKKQRQRATHIGHKNQKANVIHSEQQLVRDACLEVNDKKLMQILREYLNDMLDNSIYNSLVQEVSAQLKRGESLAEFDNFHFFRF